MGRLRLAVLVSTAALVLAAGAPLGAQAAPAKAVEKYFALEGSASHLLFAAEKTAKAFTEADARAHAREYVLDAKGRRTAVPAGYTASLLGDEPLFRKSVRFVDGTAGIRWIRPERGTSGVYTLPEASTVVAPAPGGWVVQTAVDGGTRGQAYRLRRVTTDGSLTDLGVPRPDGEYVSVQAAPTGLLIADPSDGGDPASAGTLQFMPWSKPGSYARIYPAAGAVPRIGTPIICGNASSTQVRCTVGMDEETTIRLIPLDGSKSRLSEERCAIAPAVRTAAIAWTDRTTGHGCTAGRVEQRTTAGRLTVSTRRYSPLQEPVTAFGRLVVATSTQRHLVTISTPTSTPKQLVGG